MMVAPHEEPELQPKEKPVKRRTKSGKTAMKTETCGEESCSTTKTQSKENPQKRKKLNAIEAPELQPEENPVKRTRRQTKGKAMKLKTCVEASCSGTTIKDMDNPQKKKWMAALHEELELQPKENSVKRITKTGKTAMKTEICVEASCSTTKTQSKENPWTRKRLDVPCKEPELQPKENRIKRRTKTGKMAMKTETCVEASCSTTKTQSKENPYRRKGLDSPHKQPELQSKKNQVKTTRRKIREKSMKSEKPETCVEASCSGTKTKSKENPRNRTRIVAPHEGPELEPKEMAEKRRTETNEKSARKKHKAFFNRYILSKLVKRGGCGAVYAGFRKPDGKKVALKFVHKQKDDPYVTLPGDTCRLPLEVALMELVGKPPQCPYVIELVEWLETRKILILVLERPDPCFDLHTYTFNMGMPESRAKIITQQVIQAVLHCRDRGVLHRDIKGENILLNPRTLEVKLIDFGYGALVKDTPYTTFAGTWAFQPPEWIIDKEYEAEPSTVWSLGIFLYSMLCGLHPFLGNQEIVNGHLDFPDNLSEECCSLIRWCLQQDPRKRPTIEQLQTHFWF